MRLLNDFISLFFPHCCLVCSCSLVRGEDVICTRCMLNLPRPPYRSTENSVQDKLKGRLPLTHAFAYLKFNKTGIAQHLLIQLKYKNHPEVGVVLGKVYGKELIEKGFQKEFDLIIPVPLHKIRMRKRGYNQSAKFAEGLSYVLGIPWSDSISVRKGYTTTQTNKTIQARWKNVEKAFSIQDLSRIKGKRILLVDDVVTTGATLEACGIHLARGGCATLSVACIAVA